LIFDRSFDETIMYRFLLENADQFSSNLLEQVERSGNGTLEQFVHKLCSKGTVVCEQDEKGTLKGLVIGYTHDLPPDNSSYITYLIVAPQYRRQGIATRLLDEYISYCRKLSIPEVWLTTGETNVIARAFYERYGFVLAGNYGEKTVKYVKKTLANSPE